MSFLYDYHVHSNYSTDGISIPMEICKSAIKNGLREIAITDHFEPSIGNENYPEYKAKDYRRDIEELKDIFKGKLKIKLGVELGQPHHFQKSTRDLIKSMNYDYIIGSAHKNYTGVDFSEVNYSKLSLNEACKFYLIELIELADKGDFDCIGHIDLLKRYSTNHYKTRITLMSEKELLEDVLLRIISKGKGIEINTSGLRQQPKETMPGIDLLSFYKNLGGEILTIGSDAHHAIDVAKGLENAVENARIAGFRYLTLFNGRKPEFIKISYDNKLYFFNDKAV